ncbi:HAMP domain-containing protein [Hazenella sp. IB182357]|uniref:histidine kinase n=1 Tax=Polycladospora coralii TaxID=2771432 RepID=A0A926N8E1_9BACL|nr:HAMP domain-containing protein [Polycladospora coralii]
MILRSVVGKLWLTIIVLVSLVLLLLSLFLSEQVGSAYMKDQEQSLIQLTDDIEKSLSTSQSDQTESLNQTLEAAKLFRTYMVILNSDGSTKPLVTSPHASDIKWTDIFSANQLTKVMNGERLVWHDSIQLADEEKSKGIILVADPYYQQGASPGVLVIYQIKDDLGGAKIKEWIFYSALIALILTTIFAFFLSTRITQPLIQMKRAAERMAKGEFKIRIPVRIHEWDEITSLGITFNRMAAQLEDSIHQLSQEKEQLASILRSMSDGVITIDKYKKVILSNPQADRFLALWTSDNDLPPPLTDFLKRVMESEEEVVEDVSKQDTTWAIVMAPLYAGEQVRGAVAVLRDVTGKRRLEKLRKDFVANVSHELRTPLAMLQGYSEALLDDIASTPADRKEIAQVINDESQRMSRLVRELLDLARMEAGHVQVFIDEVEVTTLVRRIERKFSTLAKEENVQLRVEMSDALPLVYWDEDKIEQVLTNLVDNAIRHTPASGSVCLSVTVQSDRILLAVADTGNGIPEEDLPFVFERFYKADKARTRGQSGGTGLGLSIVKHLVRAHQGEVTVKSQVGRGTTFTVSLPIQAKRDEAQDEM